MRLFHPLGFMLASPVETPEEAVERFTGKPEKVPVVKEQKPRKSRKTRSLDADEEEFSDAPLMDVTEMGEPANSAAERVPDSQARGL